MKISVYITSYNQKSYLKEAIDSVLGQTLLPFEIWIVDDASTDGSQELIANYCNKFPELIKSYNNTVNRGITYCRNKALSLVNGDYISWLDGDDIYLPKKLEVQATLVKNTGANLVYTNYYYSKKDILNIYQIWCSNRNELPKTKNIFAYVMAREFPRSNLFRYELVEAKLLKSISGYDENLKIYEDFDFRIRLSEYATTAYSLEPLSIYRVHGEGLSNAKKELHSDSLNYIFKKYEEKILELPPAEIAMIKKNMNDFLLRFMAEKTVEPTLIHRIKRKLIRIFNS